MTETIVSFIWIALAFVVNGACFFLMGNWSNEFDEGQHVESAIKLSGEVQRLENEVKRLKGLSDTTVPIPIDWARSIAKEEEDEGGDQENVNIDPWTGGAY
jgi:hypothetical protein